LHFIIGEQKFKETGQQDQGQQTFQRRFDLAAPLSRYDHPPLVTRRSAPSARVRLLPSLPLRLFRPSSSPPVTRCLRHAPGTTSFAGRPSKPAGPWPGAFPFFRRPLPPVPSLTRPYRITAVRFPKPIRTVRQMKNIKPTMVTVAKITVTVLPIS